MRPVVALIPLWILFNCSAGVAVANNHQVDNPAVIEAQDIEPEIPFKQGADFSASSLLKVVAILVFVLVIALLIILALKKIIIDRSVIRFPDARIRLLEARRISNRLTLFLVLVDDQEYLLSQTGDTNNMLRHRPLDSSVGERNEIE